MYRCRRKRVQEAPEKNQEQTQKLTAKEQEQKEHAWKKLHSYNEEKG